MRQRLAIQIVGQQLQCAPVPHRTKFQADHRPREWLRAGELRRHPVSLMLVIAGYMAYSGLQGLSRIGAI